ncbi:MAG: hypothetical protein AAGI68_10830 [Planctomycetota bacterium]
MRTTTQSSPLPASFPDPWSARWVAPDPLPPTPLVVDYRLVFTIQHDTTTTVWVSADQRFIFHHNGNILDRGPVRGDDLAWFAHPITLQLNAGQHELLARVWSQPPDQAPMAQHTRGHGFLLQGQVPGLDLSTGHADWQCQLKPQHIFTEDPNAFHGFVGLAETHDASMPSPPWQPAHPQAIAVNRLHLPGPEHGFTWGQDLHHRLQPSPLPTLREQPFNHAVVRSGDPAWQALIDHQTPLQLPPHHHATALLDLDDYVCGYDHLTGFGGAGATIDITWSEALHDDNQQKHNRDRVEGLHLKGRTNSFKPAGGEWSYQPLWWNAARYRRVDIRTADEPLTLTHLGAVENRYPLDWPGSCSLAQDIHPICKRALEACAHETFLDCPFYEQLQYTGDTRIQALCHYLWAGDDRLAKHAIDTFARSLDGTGITAARHPSFLRQVIPGFALYWVAMLHDFLTWRAHSTEDRRYIQRHMPTARAIIETFLNQPTADGLAQWPDGWHYTDAVRSWTAGISPDPAVDQWHLAYTLRLAAELERYCDEPGLADRLDQRRHDLATAIDHAFWNDTLGGWANTDQPTMHAQCFAILARTADPDRLQRAGQLLHHPDATAPTFYFQHYRFEALHELGRGPDVLNELQPWRDMVALGLRTTPEHPEPTRSDCHAWSAHPLFHLVATVAGLRPSNPGLTHFTVNANAPDLDATAMHPLGPIRLSIKDHQLTYTAPPGVTVTPA